MGKNFTKIGFSGDVSFSSCFDKGYKNTALLSSNIIDFFKDNDANVINQESPITACKITEKESLAHRTDVEAIDEFYKKHIPNPILSLANNHILDYGKIGVLDTCDNLDKSEIEYIGAGRNRKEASKYIIVGDDIKVGLIAIQYQKPKDYDAKWAGPFYQKELEILKNRITSMKQDGARWVVVVYHGGEEFLTCPLPINKKLLHKIADLGADAIVAHHPHVVQGYEYYNSKPIFYSLGNFIFDTPYQRVQDNSEFGMLLNMTFTDSEIKWDNMPIVIDREQSSIKVSGDNPFFVDYAKVSYSANWTYQCTRKNETLKRMNEAHNQTAKELAEFQASEKERVDVIRAKYHDDEELEEHENDSAKQEKAMLEKTKKAQRKKKIVKIVRRIGSELIGKKKLYRKGIILYNLFYKNKEIK